MKHCICTGRYSMTQMKRLYIREYPRRYGIGKAKFVAIGWICPKCKTVHLDEKEEK